MHEPLIPEPRPASEARLAAMHRSLRSAIDADPLAAEGLMGAAAAGLPGDQFRRLVVPARPRRSDLLELLADALLAKGVIE